VTSKPSVQGTLEKKWPELEADDSPITIARNHNSAERNSPFTLHIKTGVLIYMPNLL
jgi:hypothetical protein